MNLIIEKIPVLDIKCPDCEAIIDKIEIDSLKSYYNENQFMIDAPQIINCQNCGTILKVIIKKE